ncbi:hypothetical protein [Methylobacterium sp. JK268]
MRRALVLAAWLAGVGPASAQLPAPQVGSSGAPSGCPDKQAAEYAGPKGMVLWVTRRGTLKRENPLRPLTPDDLQVLEVVIRNKAATALGPDLDTLRRGAAPASLEAQSGAKIQWLDHLEGLPATLRILEDEGAGLVAALPFRGCGEAPKVAAPNVARPAAKPRAGKPRPADAKSADSKSAEPGAGPAKPAPAARTPGGFTLPQGAIP